MSSDDVNRLYQMLSELRDEVHGYRADLNGRLRTLETAEAARGGAEDARSMSKTQIASWAGVIIAGVSVCTTIMLRVFDTI